MTPKTIIPNSKQKVSPTCILLLILGVLFLIIYIFDSLTHLIDLSESTLGILLAFVIIFLGVGLILYFFTFLFRKLANIADEIEQECNDELEETEES